MATKKIKKLVLPVAGLGKRLLPLTKNTPKSLIPVAGKPLLEYVLEEAVQCGLREIVLIINPKQKKHFGEYVKKNRKRFPTLTFHTRIQETPGGNGHAVVQAADVIGSDPCAVRFCDDILAGDPPALRSLIDLFHKHNSSVVLLEQVPKKFVSRYGVVAVRKGTKKAFNGGSEYEIVNIIEKPKAKAAPSNLTIVGGYVLAEGVVQHLRDITATLPSVADDALPIAVALRIDLIIGRKLYGWEFPGVRLDCGTLDKLRHAEEVMRRS